MAVEAGRRCSTHAAGPLSTPAVLTLASTTLPFADRSNATVVAGALDLPESIRTSDCGGSLRAATSALAGLALRDETGAALLIASDARLARPGSPQELQFGAAAAALLVVRDPQAAGVAPSAAIIAAESLSADFVDHYRMSDERFDYALEDRWIRDEGVMKLVVDAIARTLATAGLGAQQIDQLVMQGPAGAARRVAQAAGLANARLQDDLRENCGDTGAAHPLLMLSAALESSSPGQRIVLIGFGQGVDVLVLIGAEGAGAAARPTVTEALGQSKPEPYYTRYLAHSGLLEPHFGMRAERDNRTAHTVAWRKRRQTTAFVGGAAARVAPCSSPKAASASTPSAGARTRRKTIGWPTPWAA